MLYNLFIYFLILISHLQEIEVSPRQFNIVWFMTQPLNSKNLESHISVKDLKFSRFVKPCTTKSEEIAPCEDEEDKRESESKKQNACDCNKVLDKNILSFLHWAQNEKKMAIATVEVNVPRTPSNLGANKNCSKKKLFKIPMNKELKSIAYHKKGNRFSNKYKIKKSQTQQLKRDVNIFDVPVFDLFNLEPKFIFNEIDRPENEEHYFNDRYHVNSRNSVTILKDDDDIYEDDAKNDVDIFDKKKVQNCPSKLPTVYDHRKENHARPKMNEDGFNLFQMVISTIDQLILVNNPHGFIALIKGGRLEELEDTNSPLAQSIDYIKRKTNEKDTLVVLSMLCPEIQHTQKNDKSDDDMLPVFCTGPHCTDLEEAEELKDLFDIVKRGLQENKADENCDGDPISSERRLARALIETVYYDENYQGNLLQDKNRMKRSMANIIEIEKLARNSYSKGKSIIWIVFVIAVCFFVLLRYTYIIL